MGAHHLVFLEREQYVYFAKPRKACKSKSGKESNSIILNQSRKKAIELVNNSQKDNKRAKEIRKTSTRTVGAEVASSESSNQNQQKIRDQQ